MNRFYLLIIFTLLTITQLSAQLSGTYTIGGSSPDYADISSAVTDLNSSGIAGAVVFNIREGNYNEQIHIQTVSGASETSTVTFKSETGNAANTIVYYGATDLVEGTDNWVLKLDNVSYLNFENLTFKAEGGEDGLGIVIRADGNVSDINFTSNRIISKTTTPTNYIASVLAQFREYTSSASNINFAENYFYGGKYFFLNIGGNNISFTDNYIENVGGDGYFKSVQNLTFTGNYVDADFTYRDMIATLEFNSIISNNVILGRLYIRNVHTQTGFRTVLTNNATERILIYGASKVNVYHNTINTQLSITSGSTEISAANNLIVSSSTTEAALVAEDITGMDYLDYNNVYSPNFLFSQDIEGVETKYTDLASWQTATGLSANSSTNEIFFSEFPAVCSNQMPLTGTDVGVTLDIDGETRILPVIGADEFEYIEFTAEASQTTTNGSTEITLTATGDTDGTVTWYNGNDAEIGQGFEITYTPAESENLTAVWTNGADCTESKSISLTVSASGTDNILQSEISVNPVPFNDFFSVKTPSNGVSIKLFNISGKLVQTYDTQSNSLNIDGRTLNSGVYILEIKTDNQTSRKKIIKY